MTWTTRIQGLVVRCNRIFPFSHLFRLPYRGAILFFARHCARHAEIEGAYLRHSLAEGHWSPGLSDIDLTVITKPRENTSSRFDFLVRFWSGVGRLERFFPMLGQIEVLDRESFGLWTQATIRGYESKNWLLVYGRHTSDSGWAGGPERLQEDAINDALATYLTHYLPRFYSGTSETYLERCLLRRIADKVVRYACRYRDGEAVTRVKVDEAEGEEASTTILAGMLCQVGARVAEFEASFPRPLAQADWLDQVHASECNYERVNADLGPLTNHLDSLVGFYCSGKTRMIVLQDHEDPQALVESVEAIRAFVAEHGGSPLILTRSIFRYLLTVYYPFQYSYFLRHCEILFGPHPLEDLHPPDVHAYRRQASRFFSEVLLFPMSRDLVIPRSMGPLQNRIRLRSEWILLLKRWLAKGALLPSYEENIARAREDFPEVASGLDNAREEIARRGAASEAIFCLFSEMVTDLRVATGGNLPGQGPRGAQ